MLSINTNISSIVTQHSMKSATKLLNQAVERMTTGYKINHAKDNAANYSIATNLTTKINSYMVAEENCAMGLDLLATANGSLDLISDKLTRLRDLATQASNGTYGTPSLEAINAEANALVDEIDRLYSTTEYNGINLYKELKEEVVVSIERPSYTEEQIEAITTITEAIASNSLVSGGTYSISTVDELVALADYVNTGNNTTGMIFVLGDDIDLSVISNWTPIGDKSTNSAYVFKGTFDGNGHIISNLKIDRSSKDYQGLFGSISSSSIIQNVGLKNVSVKGKDFSSALVAYASSSKITKCFVEGSVSGSSYVGALVGYSSSPVSNSYSIGEVFGSTYVGGLVGSSSLGINNCYTMTNVTGTKDVGGLIGRTSYSMTNSYATGDISGVENVGGLIGNQASGTASKCFATGNVEGTTNVGSLIGTNSTVVNTSYSFEEMGYTVDNGWKLINEQPVFSWIPDPPVYNSKAKHIELQIGISSSSSSSIDLETSFILEDIDKLREIGLDVSFNFLTVLDNMLKKVSTKQTEYGAVENRLESALESIAVNIENLTSSRSTIRDADIAEVSSEYIRQQILQQASATLMATANQSPSIALQLI